MNEIKEQVANLSHRLRNHHHQTDGFTWDYTAATHEQVLETSNVFPETLDGLTQVIMKIILPKDRPTLRRQIAYLSGLQQRQAKAWQWYIADCKARTENTNQWVLQNQP